MMPMPNVHAHARDHADADVHHADVLELGELGGGGDEFPLAGDLGVLAEH